LDPGPEGGSTLQKAGKGGRKGAMSYKRFWARMGLRPAVELCLKTLYEGGQAKVKKEKADQFRLLEKGGKRKHKAVPKPQRKLPKN